MLERQVQLGPRRGKLSDLLMPTSDYNFDAGLNHPSQPLQGVMQVEAAG